MLRKTRAPWAWPTEMPGRVGPVKPGSDSPQSSRRNQPGTRALECRVENAGAYFGEDCVEGVVLVDANFGYKIPNTPAEIQFAVTNLFDTPYRSFVGVPDIGRFAIVRVKYDLF